MHDDTTAPRDETSAPIADLAATAASMALITTASMTPLTLPGKNLFWPLHLAGWFGYFAFAYLTALAHGKPTGYWSVVTATSVAGFLATAVLRYPLRLLHPRGPLQFFAMALVPVLLVSAVLGVVYVLSLVEWCGEECRPETVVGYLAYMSSFIYVVLSWTGLYFGIKNYQQLQRQTEAALKATAMAHQAQLKMLRYQLNPHFLFNTLNAISTLVLDRDNQTANRMVTSLSAFLRHSLDADPMQRVTLKQELDALNLYLGIEKLRFTDRLRLRVEIAPDAYNALLPSLLLQPLIENAIKYAVARRVEGGALEIIARRDGDSLEIVVADDGPGFGPLGDDGLPPGKGVGLRNTCERLRVLYGSTQSFALNAREGGGASIVLRLPFETATAARAD
jgi:two-component system LytT family sensor kinase